MNTERAATKHLILQDRPELKDSQDQAVLSVSFVLKEICNNLASKWLNQKKIKAGTKCTDVECVCLRMRSFVFHPQTPKHTVYDYGFHSI